MKNTLLSPTMHIHPSSPNSSISEDNAAIKIQANFRGYRVRKQMKDVPVSRTSGGCSTLAVVAVTAATTAENPSGKRLAGPQTADRSEDVSATKIQAGIRGYLVRKKQKLAADAATIIQANFRGFKTRQALKNRCGGDN